jgi:hypothetical protein
VKLRAGPVAADHEHQDRFRIWVALGDVLEAADHARRKRHHVQRAKIDIFDLAVLVFPTGAPGSGHRNEGLVGVVVVHHRAMAGLGLAVAEVEALADLDGGEPRRIVADRRGHRPAPAGGRLEADDVEQHALATRHVGVRQAAVEALRSLKRATRFSISSRVR